MDVPTATTVGAMGLNTFQYDVWLIPCDVSLSRMFQWLCDNWMAQCNPSSMAIWRGLAYKQSVNILQCCVVRSHHTPFSASCNLVSEQHMQICNQPYPLWERKCVCMCVSVCVCPCLCVYKLLTLQLNTWQTYTFSSQRPEPVSRNDPLDRLLYFCFPCACLSLSPANDNPTIHSGCPC